MKIAMVNTERTRGGAARMATTLAQAINASGSAKATLYHCEDNLSSEGSQGLRRSGSRQLNAFLARLGGSRCVADLGVAADIIRRTRDADVLHLHNLHGYYLNYEYLLKHWGDRPVVWTWHDMWGATGRCGAGYECSLWQSGCQSCPHMELYPAAWIDNAAPEYKKKQHLFLERNNLLIVTPSAWLADIAAKRGFNTKKIEVIPNLINAQFKPLDKLDARNRCHLPDSKYIALFIASDCGNLRKGYEDFATVITQTSALGIAIGKPPENPHPQIQHVGSISDVAILNDYYAAADVMIIPSYADNYPTTVIESLICGTPVIGYAEGGIPSQLDLPFCQVVKKGNINELLDAVEQKTAEYGKSAEQTNILSACARVRWAQPVTISRYIEVYRKAIDCAELAPISTDFCNPQKKEAGDNQKRATTHVNTTTPQRV